MFLLSSHNFSIFSKNTLELITRTRVMQMFYQCSLFIRKVEAELLSWRRWNYFQLEFGTCISYKKKKNVNLSHLSVCRWKLV